MKIVSAGFFIFPALFIVILGPAIISVMESGELLRVAVLGVADAGHSDT